MEFEHSKESELYPQVALDISHSIQPAWTEFAKLADTASVQAFCVMQSRYDESRLDITNPMSIITYEPAQDSFDAYTAADIINTAYARANTFTQGLVEAYCLRKRLPVPDADDATAIGGIISQIFISGTSKVNEYIILSERLEDESLHLHEQQHYEHIAVSVLTTVAQLATAQYYTRQEDSNSVETNAPQQEIDTVIDEVLQAACQRIIDGGRFTAAKGANAAEQITASGMNILRTLYYQGEGQGFQTAIFKSRLLDYFAPEVNPGDYDSHEQYIYSRQRLTFEALATGMAPLIGDVFKYPGRSALNKMFLARDKQTFPGQEKAMSQLADILVRITTTHATRQLIDAVASGAIKYSAIMAAAMKLKEQPLAGRTIETTEPPALFDIILDWEVLPPDNYGPADQASKPPVSLGEALPPDMSRIEYLRSLGADWPGSYIARGTPANRGDVQSMKRAYYVLVLPEILPPATPDSEPVVVEHAIADSPRQAHALYIFRGEQGQRFQPALTWREVFSQRRGEPVKRLGALCLRHVDSLEEQLLNALTCPADEIERRRRFLLNRRETWRLARSASTETE